MSTIKIGSSSQKKGVKINPSTVLFNGNDVTEIVNGNKTLWGKGFIYDKGNEYVDITGGWVGVNADSKYQKTGGTLTKNADHMLVQNVSGGSFSAATIKTIDLSSYSKLVITLKSTGGVSVMIGGFPSSSFALSQVINPPKNEYADYEVNLSNVSGAYGIAICDMSAATTLCIQRVMLIK